MNTCRGQLESPNTSHKPATVHPAWISLIRLCREIEFGELERIKIQNGVPVMVERYVQKIKLA